MSSVVEDVQNEMAGLKIAQEIDEESSLRHHQAAAEDIGNDVNADDDDVEDEEAEEEHYRSPQMQWDTLLQLIATRTNEAMETATAAAAAVAQTQDDKEQQQTWTAAEHNAHYRATFEALREEVASRDDIPDAIATPPGIRRLRLVFCPARLAGRCPCCLDGGYGLPRAVVGVGSGGDDHASPEVGVGVTKDLLLQGLRDGLFPDVKPEKEKGEGAEVKKEERGEQQAVEAGEAGEKKDDGEDNDADDDENRAVTAEKVTLLDFCWMNDGGLMDDTLYVYYSTPEDDTSSTRSELAGEEGELGDPDGDDGAEDEETSDIKEE